MVVYSVAATDIPTLFLKSYPYIFKVPYIRRVGTSRSKLYVHRASSIICFSVDPISKEFYILLGKENWKDRRNAFWSGFSGSRKNSESPEHTASREFVEESLQIVSFNDHIHSSSSSFVKKMLLEQNYCYKFGVSMPPNSFGNVSIFNMKIVFIKQIPWVSNLPAIFKQKRSTLFDIKADCRMTNVPFALRNHPAIIKHIGRVSVNEDFLEKSSLKWWSLPKIKTIISNVNHRRRFKGTFIPVLKVALRLIEKNQEKNKFFY